jgi:hypothetical protein
LENGEIGVEVQIFTCDSLEEAAAALQQRMMRVQSAPTAKLKPHDYYKSLALAGKRYDAAFDNQETYARNFMDIYMVKGLK